MRTFSAKTGETDRKWFVVDASDYELGRLATRIATVLRGKHKPTFTPHVDTGDFVIVINASQVNLTGRKIDQKNYYRGEKEDVGSLQTVLPSSYDLLDTTLGEFWIGRIMFGVRFIAKQKSVGCMPIHVKWSWTNLWFMKKVGVKN